jgi:hypothetical protein
MELRTVPHAFVAVYRGDFDHGLDVVGGIEEGEASGEDSEQDYTGGPDVDFGGLLGAFEEHFWGAETSCSGSVGAS